MDSPTPSNDGAVFAFPQAICADCFHEQQDQPELYCPHTRTRAWFDTDANVWRMEWPVASGKKRLT